MSPKRQYTSPTWPAMDRLRLDERLVNCLRHRVLPMETFPLKMTSAYDGGFDCTVRWRLDSGRVVQESAYFSLSPQTMDGVPLCRAGAMMGATLGVFHPDHPCLIGWRPWTSPMRYFAPGAA